MSRSKSILGGVLAVIFLMIVMPATAVGDTPREIAKRVSSSVVLLVMEDAKGQPLSMGSGFIVQEGVVATNMHVIAGSVGGYAKLVDDETKHDIQGIVASDKARDLVLLFVDGIKTDPLVIGDSNEMAVGDAVYAVGNPRGLEGTFSAGIVSSVRKVGEDSLLQITAPISPGSSGGPVVNSTGQVIGVAVATFKGGQNLNFAIPSKYLSALILLIKDPVALPKAAKAIGEKKEKSLLDGLGGRNTEGVTAEKVTWDSYTQAGEFSFSLRNRLREPVENVYCLVIIYDSENAPIDFTIISYGSVILPGLAKRIKGQVEAISEKLNSPPIGGFHGADPSWQPPRMPRSRVEIRVFNFDIVTLDEPTEEHSTAPHERILPGISDESTADSPRQPRPVSPSSLEEVEAELRRLERRLAESVAKVAPAGAGPELIESRIEGEFEGWDGETIFKLENGQVWQQVTLGFTYRYAFRPKVWIIKTHGAYKMKVDGVSGAIFVKQLK